MGCVDVNDTVHMVRLRLSQSHLCVEYRTRMGFMPILCDCNVELCDSQNRIKNSQSHSHKIVPVNEPLRPVYM